MAARLLATLPTSHPLAKTMRKCAKGKVRKPKSPLHNLAEVYKADPQKIETISTSTRDPALTSKLPFVITLPPSKNESKLADDQSTDKYKIYTDGSAHGGNVGAAAVLTMNGRKAKTLRYKLGMPSEHTVFEAELVGLLLGLHLIQTGIKESALITVGIDNQAVLRALTSKLDKPGHYLAAEAIKMATKLHASKGKKHKLVLRWTAGHIGIEGNEEADKEAKKAAEGQTSNLEELPSIVKKKLKRSKSD